MTSSISSFLFASPSSSSSSSSSSFACRSFRNQELAAAAAEEEEEEVEEEEEEDEEEETDSSDSDESSSDSPSDSDGCHPEEADDGGPRNYHSKIIQQGYEENWTQTTRKTYNAYMEKFLSFCVTNQRSGCLKKVLRKGDHGNYEFDPEKLAKSLEEKSNPYSKYTYGIQKQAHKEGKAAFSRIEKVRCAMIYFFKSKSVALSQKARERVNLWTSGRKKKDIRAKMRANNPIIVFAHARDPLPFTIYVFECFF